ncbi:MAG: porin [Burkholderiales bacterium]|nr:MAG: porin [Burkholderiales bacterium]
MKKSLIALASLAVVTAASAQSSVTLYGIADIVVHKDSGVSAKMTSGGVSTSRWGIKGSEDLGGGLSANFNFEQGIDITNGSLKGEGFDRQAWVGLSGGFGELKLGKAWNAYDDVAGAVNPVFDSVLAPTNVWVSYNSYTGNPSRGVYYATPEFGGFSAAISSSFKDASADDLRVTAFHLKYENGPLFVSVAREINKYNADTETYTVLNGSYDFGAAKLLAAVGKAEADSISESATDMMLGVDVPLSDALTVSAGYASAKFLGVRGSSFGVAANYALSKRTSVYTGFRKDNDNAVDFYEGVKSRFGVGIKHTF